MAVSTADLALGLFASALVVLYIMHCWTNRRQPR